MGGSGKTPTAEFIIRHFSKKFKIAYLSRGYKRKSEGFVLANPQSTVSDLGDEAYLIYFKWGNQIQLAVDSDRRRGIRQLKDKFPDLRLIILDDGMQHRWVKPSFLLQLTPFVKPFFRNRLFPIGKLRDHPRESARAQAILFTKAPFAMDSTLHLAENAYLKAGFAPKPCYVSALHYGKARNKAGNAPPENQPIVAIAGLASNLSFFDWAEKHFMVKKQISKPDHYRYLPDFFAQNHLEEEFIVTTEKDFHKLVLIAPKPERIFFIPIEMEVYPKEAFIEQIESQL